jgi:sugar O-acyltransferase (sialic acid O-acetyltransferase NeuD family)
MRNKPLVVFGTGELSEVAAYYFEADSGRTIAAFTVDAEHIKEPRFLARPVIEFEGLELAFPPSEFDLFVAIGYSKINGLRQQKCEAGKARGYALASYVSSRASIAADVSWGANTFILEDNTIQPFVRIGEGVTMWSGNHIGHHATIGDFAFISSHVVVSGGVSIGARSFLGVNATTNDHVTIGERCVVGSGSLVTKDLADESVVTAPPAILSRVPSSRLKGF